MNYDNYLYKPGPSNPVPPSQRPAITQTLGAKIAEDFPVPKLTPCAPTLSSPPEQTITINFGDYIKLIELAKMGFKNNEHIWGCDYGPGWGDSDYCPPKCTKFRKQLEDLTNKLVGF